MPDVMERSKDGCLTVVQLQGSRTDCYPITVVLCSFALNFLFQCWSSKNGISLARFSADRVRVQDINDTVGILRDNINKANDRGQRLDALQDKTDNLAVSAQGFRRGANRVRKQMWWKDMKMRICIVVGIIILLLIIIIPSGTSRVLCS